MALQDLTSTPEDFVSHVSYSDNSPQTSGNITLGTWNLEYFPYAGNKLSKGVHSNTYVSLAELSAIYDYRDLNIEMLARRMKDLAPSIMAFQEIAHIELFSRTMEASGFVNLAVVRYESNDRMFFGSSKTGPDGTNVLQMMAIASRFPIDPDDVWLLDFKKIPSGYIPPRGILAVKVVVPGSMTLTGNDTPLVIYNVHLKSNVVGKPNQDSPSYIESEKRQNIGKREIAIEYLKADMKKRKTMYGDETCFAIMGDFNTSAQEGRVDSKDDKNDFRVGSVSEKTLKDLLKGPSETNPEKLYHVYKLLLANQNPEKGDRIGLIPRNDINYNTWKSTSRVNSTNDDTRPKIQDFDHIIVNDRLLLSLGNVQGKPSDLVKSNEDITKINDFPFLDASGKTIKRKGREVIEKLEKSIPYNGVPKQDAFMSDHMMVLCKFG